MKKLLLTLPLMLSAAEPSKPIDIPGAKVKIFTFPKEVVAAEQERSARRKKRLSKPIDIAKALNIPSPQLEDTSPKTPKNSPENEQTILWDVLVEGKLVRLRINVEPVPVKLRFGATTTEVEKKDK
jgi:hypothetical protein